MIAALAMMFQPIRDPQPSKRILTVDPDSAQNAGSQQGAAPAPLDDQEFDAGVAEFSGETSTSDNGVMQPPADFGESTAEPPAPTEPVAAPAPPAADPAPAGQTPNDDVWANAPPELREARDRELRDANLRFQGSRGRQTAAERRVQELTEQLNRNQGGAPQGQQPEATPEPPKSGNITLDRDKFKQLREDYPEVAGPLVDVIEGLVAEVGKLQQTAGAFEQTQVTQHVVTQESFLAQQHPDWQAVAADDRFAGWVETQPQAIKDAMGRNRDAIVDGADAALVIGKFKADLGLTGTAPPPPSPPPPSALDQRRERQMAGARDVGKAGAPVTTGIPDEFDAAVDFFTRE